MSMHKEGFLTLANELACGATESHWRSSVSRAYYCAYHGCKDWHGALPSPGSNTGPTGGLHQQLVNRLSHPAPEVKNDSRFISKVLGAKLDMLRLQRYKADYALEDSVDAVQAARACSQAKEILSNL